MWVKCECSTKFKIYIKVKYLSSATATPAPGTQLSPRLFPIYWCGAVGSPHPCEERLLCKYS